MTRFAKGISGNPLGRPRGIPDKRTALRELLASHAEELLRKLVDSALNGDMAALKLCIEKLIPTPKAIDEPVRLGYSGASPADQARTIINAAAEGRLSPDQAATFVSAIAAQARVIEVDELERRVAALESNHALASTNRAA
jgi:hypothetical protein